ncbi:MAG: stage II sporulation protein M, partial [Verrucomicrobiales bacterium]
HIGAATGYVHYAGDPEKFYRFVAGHSSFELLGMIVVGIAGLKLGGALLAPGRYPRGQALTRAGRAGLPLLLGGAAMTAFAAVVEGFWSAQPLPTGLKYAIGLAFWLLHLVYFLFAGRGADGA